MRLISFEWGSSKLVAQSSNAFALRGAWGTMGSITERLLPPDEPGLVCSAPGSSTLFLDLLPVAPRRDILGAGRVLTYTSPAGQRPVQQEGGAAGRTADGAGGADGGRCGGST